MLRYDAASGDGPNERAEGCDDGGTCGWLRAASGGGENGLQKFPRGRVLRLSCVVCAWESLRVSAFPLPQTRMLHLQHE